jgi:hypothetical protein
MERGKNEAFWMKVSVLGKTVSGPDVPRVREKDAKQSSVKSTTCSVDASLTEGEETPTPRDVNVLEEDEIKVPSFQHFSPLHVVKPKSSTHALSMRNA